MVNKNRYSDLFHFFFAVFTIIGAVIAFVWFGWSMINGKTIKMLDAKISNYIQQQWQAGGE